MNANQPVPDRMAIAEQVIVSAGNVLTAAGFTRAEIASFLRQAADAVAPEGVEALMPSQQRMDAGPGIEQLKTEFAGLLPVQELARMHDAVGDARSSRLDLAHEMVPHIAEAQDWLRSAAESAGLTLVANRAGLAGSPAMSQSLLFLDEFESAYAESLATIRAAVNDVAESGSEADFCQLLARLVDANVIINHELKEAMEAAARALS